MSPRVGIGIDVGGTNTKIAAVTSEGRVIRELEIPTRAQQSAPEFVRRVCSVLHLLESELGSDIMGVGLGIAGDVDSRKGVLRFSPNLSRWNGFDFISAFSKRLKRPIVIDNDANLAAWGGYVMELKAKPANVIGVTLGTGVGGGVILDKKLYRGSTGSAGEIGHTQIEVPGESCPCGALGCLEAYVGSQGIVRRAKRMLKTQAGRKSRLRRAGVLDPRAIAEAAEQGDALAREVWTKTGGYLAIGLSNLVMLLNPDVLLIFGGVSRAGRWLLEPIKTHLAARPFRTPFKRVSVRMAKNHNWGCVGAALLALDQG